MRAAHALPRRAARGAAVLSMRAGRAQLGNPCRPSHAFTRGPHNTLSLQRDDGLLQQPAGLPASSLSSAATAQQMQPPPAQIIRMHGTDAHVCLAPSASPSSRSTLACAHHCEWHSRQIGWRAQTSADGSHNRARESPDRPTRPVARCAYYTGRLLSRRARCVTRLEAACTASAAALCAQLYVALP